MTDFVGRLVDDGRRVRLFVGDALDDAVVARVLADLRADRPGRELAGSEPARVMSPAASAPWMADAPCARPPHRRGSQGPSR